MTIQIIDGKFLGIHYGRVVLGLDEVFVWRPFIHREGAWRFLVIGHFRLGWRKSC